MNPWMRNLLCGGGGGGGGPVLPPAGRTMLANLKSSLILGEGTGTPTWSRATKAWGFNELGYLEELASGCAFFGGARLVRNTVRTKSEDFSNVDWDKSGMTVSGTNNIICSNTSGVKQLSQGAMGSQVLSVGQLFVYGFRLRRVVNGASFVQIAANSNGYGTEQYCNVSLLDWRANAVGCTCVISPVSENTADVIIRVTCVTSGTHDRIGILFANSLGDLRLPVYVGDGIKSFELLRAWSVDVTGYDASYVPEYVSVGVLSAPFHGAGIDGAKYFETDWQGAPIPAANLLKVRREASAINNLLHCRDLRQINWTTTATGSEFVVNGGFAVDTDWIKETGWSIAAGVATKVAGTGGSLKQTILTTASKTYYVEIILTVSAGTLSISVGSSGIQTPNISASGTYTYKIIAGTGAQMLNIYGSSTYAGTVDSVSVKEAAVQVTQATGLDGIANTATTLTAFAADAIILQPISLVSAARCASAYVKRRTGTGTISFTQDGGSTWTDITSQINSSTWSRVQITATLANPSVGFKISTSGDAIDVDCVQNEAGAEATSPIVTTTATITRNADSLSYQTASNWSDTAGTAYIEAQPWQWSVGGLVGSATNGLLESASNSGATAYDGTNAANGPAGSPSGRKKLALRWTGATMDVSVGGVIGTAGTYDGAMGLSSLGIAVNSSGYFGPVAVWNYAMTDDEFKALTT